MIFLPGRNREAAEVADIFAAGVSQTGAPSDFRYEAGQTTNLQPIVQWILRNFMVPWLLRVLKKWSEPQFHSAMNATYIDSTGKPARGRDFIADFKMNHSKKFGAFIKLARKNRSALRVDLNDQVNRLVMVLNQKGWRVYDHEKLCFHDTLRKVMAMVYA